MKTAVVGLTKSSHGTNIVEGNVAGEPAEAHNEDILETALTALGIGASGQPNVKDYTASGAIAEKSGTVTLSGTGAQAMTLANPTSGTDDGKVLRIISKSAHAHTVTMTAAISGGSNHKSTYGGAIGDALVLEALGGAWFQLPSINQTLSAS
jgi:hypothetical protein